MEIQDIHEQVDLIREVFAYTERYQGSTFVIKIDNALLGHLAFPQLVRDLAMLHRVGIRMVLVPGAGQRIKEILDRFNVSRNYINATLICPPEAIDLIKMAAFDTAHRVMTALSGQKITAVIGNWVRARGLGVVDGVDSGRTGVVDRIRIDAVFRSLEQGHIPLFPCIGHNEIGDPYNLSSDELAKTLALASGAKKLFFVVDDVLRFPDWNIPQGINPLEDGRISRMSLSKAKEFLRINQEKAENTVLNTAISACQEGVERTHLIDGRIPGVLLQEIFSNLGVGTMIFSDSYDQIRPMEHKDIPRVLDIMRPMIDTGLLLERSRNDIIKQMEDYVVYTADGSVHGCAALHSLGDSVGEIIGLVVNPQYNQLGIGAIILDHLEQQARNRGIKKLLVLTIKTADWFLAKKFKKGGLQDLPPGKSTLYNRKRNSLILVKEL